MNITIFNKKYWIRRFDEQKEVRGYLTSGRHDFQASLHIHPLSTDQQQALPEGERKIKRLEGHGEIELIVADQDKNRKGDLLYYHGDWWECVNSQMWDHTLLSHYNYQFTPVPRDAARSPDIENPPGEIAEEAPPEEAVTEEPAMPPATETTVGGVIVEPGSGLRIDEEGYLCIDAAEKEQVEELFGTGGDENAGE